MKSIAALELQLDWTSDGVRHSDVYFAPKVNLWRDILPGPLADGLAGKAEGDSVGAEFGAGELVPEYNKSQVITVRDHQFRRDFSRAMRIEPRLGRFYPAGVLDGVSGIFKSTRTPLQCTAIEDNGELRFDLNHPLARYPLGCSVTLRSELKSLGAERGGVCFDWAETAAGNGPGMQARRDFTPDYRADDPFKRMDEGDDLHFYAHPRLINHLDDAAIGVIRGLYGKLVKPGMRVLDLMSSWVSHLPEDLNLEHVTGLGLNRAELEANPRLHARVVHDLNAASRLPFADASFDAVICTASVEYLSAPFTVFEDLARVLKPGGILVQTFSNRWFPPKAIKIWGELHEFERMRLVLEYFLRSGRYRDLHTFSMRNLPRPQDDKYYTRIQAADPIYSVWGVRN